MRGLITRGVSPPWTTAADEELTRRAFGRGEAVFLRNWPYALDLLERGDSPVRGRVGVAPLPRHRDGARGAGSTGGSHLAIHRGTRHPDLALELVRALTSESAQRLMVSGAALYPTRVALYHAPDLVRAQPALPAIAALTLAGRPRPVTPYYVTISTLLQPELSAAIVGVKAPARAVADARRAVGFVLRDVRAARGRAALTPRQRADRRLGLLYLSPALDRARRPHRLSRSLGALALAPAAHADLRHRALRRPRQLSLPTSRTRASGARRASRSSSPSRRCRSR